MNTNQVTELAGFLLSTLKESKQFVLSQSPDVIQQILTYDFYLNLLGVIIFGILLVPVIYYIKKMIADKEDLLNKHPLVACYLFFASVICGPLFIFSIIACIKIQLAPKLYLLEYFKGLL